MIVPLVPMLAACGARIGCSRVGRGQRPRAEAKPEEPEREAREAAETFAKFGFSTAREPPITSNT